MAKTAVEKYAAQKRYSKRITNKEDLDFLFNASIDECNRLSFIMECFGDFNGKRRFQPYDIITVPPGVYGKPDKKNKNSFTTTVGLFVFNRAFIEKDLIDICGYVSEPVTKKLFGKLNKKISYALMEDDIELDALKRFILLTQKFQAYVDILSPTFTPAMLTMSSKLQPLNDELWKKYEKEIAAGDTKIASIIDKELIKKSKELLAEDPSTDMINSGAKPNWDNNYRHLWASIGASRNSDPNLGEFSILKGNYMDGVSREEYAKFADSMVGGPYARAKKTEVGGAWEKMIVRAFQHCVIDTSVEDCGTKRTLPVTFNDKNIDDWMYSYYVEGSKLIEINSKNKDSLIGKTKQVRWTGFCEHTKGFCKTCSGNLFTKLGIVNVGVSSYCIASKIKLLSMKSFHDSSVKIATMSSYGYAKIFGGAK